MNLLNQTTSLLIGSQDAVSTLSQIDSARILVVSDTHDGTHNLLQALHAMGIMCDAMVFCGDGIGDVAYILEASTKDPFVKSIIPPVISVVRGNGDPSTESFVRHDWEENPKAEINNTIRLPMRQTLEAAGHKLMSFHGHGEPLYLGTDPLVEAAHENGCDICLFGHTHIAISCIEQDVLILNPGSITLPRDGQPKTFAVLELERNKPLAKFNFYALSSQRPVPFTPENYI